MPFSKATYIAFKLYINCSLGIKPVRLHIKNRFISYCLSVLNVNLTVCWTTGWRRCWLLCFQPSKVLLCGIRCRLFCPQFNKPLSTVLTTCRHKQVRKAKNCRVGVHVYGQSFRSELYASNASAFFSSELLHGLQQPLSSLLSGIFHVMNTSSFTTLSFVGGLPQALVSTVEAALQVRTTFQSTDEVYC